MLKKPEPGLNYTEKYLCLGGLQMLLSNICSICIDTILGPTILRLPLSSQIRDESTFYQ